MPPSEMLSTVFAMPARADPGECRNKYQQESGRDERLLQLCDQFKGEWGNFVAHKMVKHLYEVRVEASLKKFFKYIS